jgi:hypothetical protein
LDAQHPQADEFGADKSRSSKVVRFCVIGWTFGGLARFLLLNDGH